MARYTRTEIEAFAQHGVEIYSPDLKGLDLSRAGLEHARMPRADFADAAMHFINLSGARLVRAVLPRVRAAHAVFSGAHLDGATFPRAILNHAHFDGAECAGTDFAGASLGDADFTDANLEGAKFWYATVTLDQLRCCRDWDRVKHSMRGISALLAQEARDATANSQAKPIPNAITAIVNDAHTARATAAAQPPTIGR